MLIRSPSKLAYNEEMQGAYVAQNRSVHEVREYLRNAATKQLPLEVELRGRPIKSSAPGSMMWLGEYAVLHNKQAMVCAIDKRITVYLSPRRDTQIIIKSKMGECSCDISDIDVQQPFQFVLTAIKRFQGLLKTGCDIEIESEFTSQVGLASSAAVTVAIIAAFNKWLHMETTNQELIAKARSVVQEVQGLGSGADVAACVLGGIVSYSMDPLKAERLDCELPPITVIYSGAKTPTVAAVNQLHNRFLGYPSLLAHIYDAINACAQQGVQCVSNNCARDNNWPELGRLMNINQGLMDSLGVSNSALSEIITYLREQPSILGAKISGSGLGDCVIGLGRLDSPPSFKDQKIRILPISITSRGVECE